ncbi:mechanosensitive ion channel domain-containing protein [Picrophilus oshimae]|uniref:Mechanosensitive ion channel n=1 Tax=Picrophilus torridus (strain ATCC 700027 / DSM 9790 / JCM 10055 / NBRC 100828 / KAW 2/3) TaxID=1122961 RepID=Q6KZN6_PICTO|nr:mechanosensitive ion channel domain-containing protein [Picrophilus oshimae]AAT43816.1 mechanosensitive ion channel [Picrophilus oshimae DSM 9789]
MTINRRRNEIIKIIAEIIIGIALTIAVGFIIDYIITAFLPHYISYEKLINEGVRAIIVFVIGFMIASSFIKYIELRIKTTKASLYGIALIVRIVIYVILIAIVLTIFHVSVTGILAGSAIGGVVLGLAVQTIATNLLSGLFVSSTSTLKYGDVLTVNSWVWSVNTTGKIIEVKTLFSKMLTKDGNIISMPNSALLGSSAIVEYKDNDGYYNYPIDITLNADVPLDLVISRALKTIDNTRFYISSKNGSTNTIHVIIRFRDVTEINDMIDNINRIIDRAYWDVKNNMVLFGSYATAISDDYYKILVSLPADVSPGRIIEGAGGLGIELYLVSKNGSTNVYMAKFRSSRGMEFDISDVNTRIDDLYQKLKKENN